MNKNIYIITGEASGDFLGAQLMTAIKEQAPDTVFSGIGGERMEALGLKSLFSMDELSLMGIIEILPNLKKLMGRIQQTADDIIQKKPDIVLTIDAPDFCFRVHKKLRKALGNNAPQLVHYVAPTVWAWRPKRAKKISKFLDALICLFHFEPQYFKKEGLRAIAVGHPMMESGIRDAKPLMSDGDGKRRLGIFFGSRRGEVARLAPILIEAVQEIIKVKPDIELIVPTLPYLKDDIEERLKVLPIATYVFIDRDSKWGIFKSCDAAIAVSGTVGLELSAANVPHLIAYNMNKFTAVIVRLIIKTRFAHLANIIMDKEIVPEFIQQDCEPKAIAKEAIKLLDDDQVRIAQQNAFGDVRSAILGQNGEQPSKTAADFILSI